MEIWTLLKSGGFVMAPLVACSLALWWVVFERFFRMRRMREALRGFQADATQVLLTGDAQSVRALCLKAGVLPTAQLVTVAMDRLSAKDDQLRTTWRAAVERRRQVVNQDLRQNLWVLGTIASSAPFIGLFGTVVGILRSFKDIAETGKGGFAIVASGISEALIATAAGILVAVIALIAFNAFQTRWSSLVFVIRIQTEELLELIERAKWHSEA
ncbi:MAG: MotA/TolQ/ExbB proton channel family protein [Bacteriovoracia bacterium]